MYKAKEVLHHPETVSKFSDGMTKCSLDNPVKI